MLETTPSIIYTTLYETCNTELDQLAYQLCRILNQKGHSSIFMPRDGYGHISILVDEPTASFSQVYAAKYAGLGTVGYNHTLLTPQYGPRVRFVSVLTSLKIPGTRLVKEQLCTHCLMCAKCCPTHAFEIDKSSKIGSMNKIKCAEYHAQLREAYRFPCGVCIKVCPVGKDRELYESNNMSKYLSYDKENQEYQSWKHCQRYGSKPLENAVNHHPTSRVACPVRFGVRDHALLADSDAQFWIDWLVKDGKIKEEQFKPSDIYTNQFNPYYEK